MPLPVNPANGTIVELKPGVFLQYDINTRSWFKIEGRGLPSVATAIKDGLMSHDDFHKLNRLYVPPYRTTIKGNNCALPFVEGNLQLYNGDEFLNITSTIDIANKINGEVLFDTFENRIHPNTVGITFDFNFDTFLQAMMERGQIKIKAPQGDQGPQGKPGKNGDNLIETGPKGDPGSDGEVPTTLGVLQELLQLDTTKIKQENRAVTDVSIDEDNQVLNVTRSIIGGQNAVASTVQLGNGKSTWLLALECGLSTAGIASPIYYVDIQPILEQIKEKFDSEVARVKQGYEDTYAFWLETMADLFDSQKSALACALEFCRSRHKAASQRQYIESQRIQAAHGDGLTGPYGIIVTPRGNPGTVEVSQSVYCDSGGGSDVTSPSPSPSPNPLLAFNVQDVPEAQAFSIKSFAPRKETAIRLDALRHVGPTNAIEISLPAGKWLARITTCCAKIDNQYTGLATIVYNGDQSTSFLNQGSFETNKEASSNYTNLTLEFEHHGNTIKAFIPGLMLPDNSGVVFVSLSPVLSETESLALGQVPKAECLISLAIQEAYEKAWKDHVCCGFVATILGQQYVIIRRSISSECGGGESFDSPHVKQFINTYGFPSLAFPTFDGESLVLLGDINYRYDKTMNDIVRVVINDAKYHNVVGDQANLADKFGVVLFPSFT